MDYMIELNGHVLEYVDGMHVYLCDGIIVPSITQVLKAKFGKKYAGVDHEVLQRASEKGTAVHDAIEAWCRYGTESDLPEVKNFKFLQRHYDFSVIDNEVPVLLCKDGEPISAGRLDLVIAIDGVLGIADIKRTATLDKEYLAYQLNLYRLAFMQSYEVDIDFLRGIHLREDVRKFVNLPINEELAWELVNKYMEENNE